MLNAPRGIDAQTRNLTAHERRMRIYESNLTAREKLVMLCLESEHDSRGISLPRRTIAQRTSIPERSVRDVIASLVDKLAIAVLPGAGKGRNQYLVNYLVGDPQAERGFALFYKRQVFHRMAGWNDGQLRRRVAKRREERDARKSRGTAHKAERDLFDELADEDDSSPFFPDFAPAPAPAPAPPFDLTVNLDGIKPFAEYAAESKRACDEKRARDEIRDANPPPDDEDIDDDGSKSPF